MAGNELNAPSQPNAGDPAIVYRLAKRVGTVIAVMGDGPPPIEDYAEVIRRGIEAGYEEMLETLGMCPREDGQGEDDG